MTDKYEVVSFGRDNNGHLIGYQVQTISLLLPKIVGEFRADIYTDNSFEKAFTAADMLCSQLNQLNLEISYYE